MPQMGHIPWHVTPPCSTALHCMSLPFILHSRSILLHWRICSKVHFAAAAGIRESGGRYSWLCQVALGSSFLRLVGSSPFLGLRDFQQPPSAAQQRGGVGGTHSVSLGVQTCSRKCVLLVQRERAFQRGGVAPCSAFEGSTPPPRGTCLGLSFSYSQLACLLPVPGDQWQQGSVSSERKACQRGRGRRAGRVGPAPAKRCNHCRRPAASPRRPLRPASRAEAGSCPMYLAS